jgi:hypothetical protein
MLALTLVAALLGLQTPDSVILAATRSAVESEPIEAFGAATGSVRIRSIVLLDVDQDGAPEAFVWITPSFRQTPTVLAYAYSSRAGSRRIIEALAPGRLQPLSRTLRDPHTLGRAVDLTVGDGKSPVDTLRVVSVATSQGMSTVRYRTFFHADIRDGFVTYVDLSDRDLPGLETSTCEQFEFSALDGLASGHLAGDSLHTYLVALTTDDLSIYRFDGFGQGGIFRKRSWTRPRPVGASALEILPGRQIAVRTLDGRLDLIRSP